MIGGAKGIGIGIDFGIPNQYCRATSKPYIEKDVLDSLRVVASAYGKSNDDADRSIVKNLVDASNPFIISNAAFKLNSGFGEYKEDFTSWRIYPNIKVTDNVITTNGNFNSTWFIYKHSSESKINEMNIKVSGIPKGGKILYFYISDETANLPIAYTIPKDGIYHLSESKINNNRVSVGFAVESSYDWNNIRIEQIPSFEGAFVTDGIDDLITSTKTVQEMLGGSTEFTAVSMIHLISPGQDVDGAAYTNYIRTSDNYWTSNRVSNVGKTGIYGYSFKQGTPTVINNILGDKNDYTTEKSDIVSDSSVSDLFRAKFSVEGFEHVINGAVHVSSVAWYWTIIANKVLTSDQINQVIAYFNLDRTLNPDILCNTIKQGITNENHAEFGDKLIDFSGNGRDIQLNNIAWKGDSGIGKYETDFTKWLLDKVVDITIKYSSFNIKTKNDSRVNSWVVRVQDTVAPSMKIKVTGISSSVESLIYRYSIVGDTDYYIDITSDGIYELPQTDGKSWEGFRVIGKNFNISVEQIPSHAGALCFDGVDDFGINKDVPTFTDFTVIAKRTWLEENTSDKPFIIKGDSLYPDGNQNAFLFEYGKLSTYSFGQNNKYDESVVPSLISYATTYSYNGVIPLVRGSATDTIGIDVAHSTKIALYFLMLFPYSMSEFLIERQLKKHKLGTLYPNMMEFRPIVKSNLPYSSISYSVNPGEYISVDSMVTITVTLPNTSDELMEVSCNAISDISISGDNGVYEITGKIVKSPQKINLVISSYLTMLNNETLISNETLIKNE